jgi:hypothetical protein
VCGISVNDIVEMHRLFAALHETADLPTFLHDLQTNDGAIIVRDGETKAIGGFITIKRVPLWDGQQQALGVLSGEAVLDPASCGEGALNDAFTRHLLYLWLTSRGVPLYWLLISRSYKAYMLMANNFASYHPRPDGHIDPKLQRLMRQYTETLSPGRYNEARGIVDAGDGGQGLRDDVDPITATMRLQDPVIDYFERSNPGWRIGHQLPCIGEISMSSLKPHLLRERLKIQGRRKSSADRSAPPQIEAPC